MEKRQSEQQNPSNGECANFNLSEQRESPQAIVPRVCLEMWVVGQFLWVVAICRILNHKVRVLNTW